MQYVRGGDLAAYAAGRRLEAGEVVLIGIDLGRALAAAWAEGIVHLDLKPANVLRGDRGEWKVTDFGLARAVEEAEEEAAARDRAAPAAGGGRRRVAGTPAYMAVEQWRGAPVDGRTDLYALGVTLYELLAGRVPFEVPDGPVRPRAFATSARATDGA